MPRTWPKVLRDPVHNIIPFEDSQGDHLLLELINTKEFQRLRRIKQLGMSDLVFPGANHTRFAHSIGVMHVSRRFIEAVNKQTINKLDKDQQLAVLVAALLHDLGHGPYSHAFETITKQKHEHWTEKIILDDSTEVNKILKKYSKNFPSLVCVFFSKRPLKKKIEEKIPQYLRDIVSSQLDADRIDYLLRDSHASGTIYGHFDYNWLLQHLCIDEAKSRLYLSRKALSAAEAYLFARYHMYQSVYYHKTTRSAEVMLRLLFDRFRELLQNADSESEKNNVVIGAPRVVVDAFSNNMTIETYLLLDDFSIAEFLKSCMNTKDKILKELGTGLIHRKLFKCTDATNVDGKYIGNFRKEVEKILRRSSFNPNYSFEVDTAADVPYKPYDPDQEVPERQIYIENAQGQQVEISSISAPLQGLRNKYNFLRYYYPEKLRKNISGVADSCLKEGKA